MIKNKLLRYNYGWRYRIQYRANGEKKLKNNLKKYYFTNIWNLTIIILWKNQIEIKYCEWVKICSDIIKYSDSF